MSKYSKRITSLVTGSILLLPVTMVSAKDVCWFDGKNAVSCYVPKNVDPVVGVSVEMFANDMKAVTGKKAVQTSEKKAAMHWQNKACQCRNCRR